MDAIQKASQETLMETHRSLSASYEYIKENGYRYQGYPWSTSSNPEVPSGSDGCSYCYVGTLAWVAGEHCIGELPRQTPSTKLALEVLDHIAVARGGTTPPVLMGPGATVEHLGYVWMLAGGEQQEKALELYKDAVCQVWAGLDGPAREILVEPLKETAPAEEPVETEVVETEPEPVPA